MQEFSWNVRDYEVSIWTLLDSYLTTLKSADGYYDVENSKLMSWPRTRYRGQIQNGVMVLNMDGTRTFNFDIPMYIEERGQRIENPNWYTTLDGNTIVAMRKIKVIFNKLLENVDKTKSTFEFIILKVTETHELDNCICHVECEGLAFHELGKVGYKIALNRTIYENDYSEWVRDENAKEQDKPKNNINYWLNKAGLELLTSSNLSPTEWRYDILMSHTDIISSENLSPKKIYDERYVNDWDDDGKAISIAETDEKYRLVDISESNLYNITQDIAETFGVFCRYEYYYDDTYQIIGKCIVFYNNYVKEDEGMVSFLYPSNADKISRTMDSTDITTKMFVRDVISDVNYNGLISIMNCPANYSKEDYLMNFDYLHMIGTIGDEQYNYIKEYWKEMRKANDNIIPLLESLNYLLNIKTDAEAKEKTLEESVKLDLERITESRALLNSLDSEDGDEDGYITVDYRDPETLRVMKDSTSTSYDSYYVLFNSNGKLGIDPNTVELYEKYMLTALLGEKKYFIPKKLIRHLTTIKGSDGKTAKLNEDLWGDLEATTNSSNVYLGRTSKRLNYVGTFTESISALSDLNPSTDNTVISIYLYIGEDNKEIPITKDSNTKKALKTNQLVYYDQGWNVKGDSNTNRYYIWSYVQTTLLNGQKTDLYLVEGICLSESTRKHVNYVRKLYYGSKNAPDKLPGKKTTIEATDVLNKWTTYLPTIKTGMQLWECLEYHYSSGTVHYRGVTNIDNPTSYAGNINELIESEANAKENVLQNPITNYISVYDDYNNLTKATNLWIRKKSGAYNEYKLIESNSVPVVPNNSTNTNIDNIITNLEGIKNFDTTFPEISLTESGEKYVLIRDEHYYSEGGTSFKRYNYSIVYYKDGLISIPSENKVVSATKIFYLNTKEELPTLDKNEKGWTETAPKREKSTLIVYEAYRVTTSDGDKKYTSISKIETYKIYKNKEDKDNIPTYIYAIYRYKPDLYYKQIEEYWGKKYDNDTAALKKALRKTSLILKKIDTITSRLDSELESKRKQVAKFELMMGPALRESYWLPDDEYLDYGTHKENKNMEYLSLQGKIFNNLSVDTSYAYYPIESDIARLGWDSNLFENETANYYESGASLEKNYYPCIDVTNIRGANDKLWLDIYAEEILKKIVEPFSVYFNPTNEIIPTGENKNDLSYCKAYTLGSLAELVKIYDASKGILKDVIMITGASELSDSELANLKATWKIGLLKIQEKNNEITYSPRTSTMINHDDSKWLENLSDYRVVMPRIIIPSLKLKVSDDLITLKLSYTDNDKEKFIRLKLYEHYYVNTLSYYKEENDSYPSDILLYKNLDNDTFTNDFKISKLRTYYTLTIRPEVYYKYFNYNKLAIDYLISNADTSIYLDAKTILKENSIPQVSYDINTIFWKSDFNNELYTKLAQIIMINDTELKFDNVFGYISEITIDLDHLDKDSIQIKNYKTKFEDLFSRIVAETEEMHKNSHNIDLASGLLGGSGISLSSPLSEEGFQKTIKDNQDLLREFLDEYFDGPNVVREQALKMWNEAGEILGSAARSLDSVMGLTTENASILASFRENVAAALTPNVFTSDAPPSAFKPGDVWIHGENNDVSVAVSPYGFTKTRDGKLSEITGANVGFDAEKGTVDIYGQFNINMTSGENIYIAAGSDIDIIGNNTVNIGGATINLASVYKVLKVNGEIAEDDDEGDKAGGIHLLASYIEWKDNDWNYTKNASSKVDITGEGITLASKNGIVIKSGAGIDIKSSDDENVSAVLIDKDKGIYLGSTLKVSLFSGDISDLDHPIGASVELSKDHLLLGMANIGVASATALEMTTDLIILAAGDHLDLLPKNNKGELIINDIIETTVTSGNNTYNLAGVQIKSDYIGMATGQGIDRSIISLKPDLITLGIMTKTNNTTPDTPENYSGSFLWLSNKEVYIGSMGNFTLNTNNIKIQSKNLSEAKGTSDADVEGMGFALGMDLLNSNPEVGLGFWIKKTTSNGTTTYEKHLVVDGDITARSFKLENDGDYKITVSYSLVVIINGILYDENNTYGASRPTTSLIKSYSNGLVASNNISVEDKKANIYIKITTTTTIGGKSKTEISYETTDKPVLIHYAISSSSSLSLSDLENLEWNTDYATVEEKKSTINCFMYVRTKTFDNGTWNASYSCSKLVDDNLPYVDSIRTLYYLRAGENTPNIPDEETDVSDKTVVGQWTSIIPSYPILINTWNLSEADQNEIYLVPTNNKYTRYIYSNGLWTSKTINNKDHWYYTCILKHWVHLISSYNPGETNKYESSSGYEWDGPAKIDYGLSTIGLHATAASKAAADAATAAEPITAYGLIGKNDSEYSPQNSGSKGTNDDDLPSGYSWDDMKGYPMWNNTTYGLILGNSTLLPMLIGSNGGVTIADTNLSSEQTGYGSAIVLKGGGIGMHGSSIVFTTVSDTTTNAIAIDSTGITMGTSGTIKLLSSNIIVDSTAKKANSLFELKNNNNETAMKYSLANGLEVTGAVTATSLNVGSGNNLLTYNINDGLIIKGKVTATSFTLASNDYSTTKYYLINTNSTAYTSSTDKNLTWSTSAPNLSGNQGKYLHTKIISTIGGATSTVYDVSYISKDGKDGKDGDSPEPFTIDGLSTGTRKITTSGSNTTNTVELTSTTALVLGANYGLHVLKGANSALDDSYLSITKDHINLDISASNYIHMDRSGIDIKGSRIKINDNEVWARDDIIIMKRPGAAGYQDEATIEEEMRQKDAHDWVLIKPYYDAKIEYTGDIVGGDGKGTLIMETPKTFRLTQTLPSGDALVNFGSSATWYQYDFSGYFYTIHTNGNSSTVQFIITLTATKGDNTRSYTLTTPQTTVGESSVFITVSSPHIQTNLCEEGYVLSATIEAASTGYRGMFEHGSAKITCTCDATTSKVPCTVYYHP